MVTTTLSPGRNGCAGSTLSGRMRVGTRCTTLVKFPVALSGGSSENLAPVAGLRLSTCPANFLPGYEWTVISSLSVGGTALISVSLSLVTIQTSSRGTTVING